MADTTYRATPEQWADIEQWGGTLTDCLLELRDRLKVAEQRISELEAGATCPHVRSSDEGTSYCALAEQQAAPPPEPAPAGSLVERVAIACAKPCNETWDDQARAAIREVAAWLRGQQELGARTWAWHLEQEAER